MIQRVFGVTDHDIRRWVREKRLTPVQIGPTGKQCKYSTLEVAALLGVDTGFPAVPVFIGETLRETYTQCTESLLNKVRKDVQEELQKHLGNRKPETPKPHPVRPAVRKKGPDPVVVGDGGSY